jgi:hypothetical protein
MKRFFKKSMVLISTAFLCNAPGQAAAIEVDWSGQFWSELNYVNNYSTDGGGISDPRVGNGGYYVPSGGNPNALFQNLFLRLRPKAIINDNISIKSEWWVLDPIFGLYGSSLPYSTDQNQFYSSQSRGSVISAQRIWGEFISDLGTFQIGRVPLQWGLGLVWNSGDNLWDRYMSTGDAVRWIAKFGSFTVAPSYIFYTTGSGIGAQGGVSDYSLVLKYENPEDELEAGINLLNRRGGNIQDPNGAVYSPGGANLLTSGLNYWVYDLYARKRLNQFTFGIEIPIAQGKASGVDYQGLGLATEVDWKASDSLSLMLKAGYASGQQSGTASANLSKVQSFYFNPNYHIGMIMFNYQLSNFAQNQTNNNPTTGPGALRSPYDNPIVNAAYLALSAQIKPSDKWTLRPALIYAAAPNTAKSDSGYFYNYWTRTTRAFAPGANNQGSSLGIEADLGISFQWDEFFTFALDTGMFFPGSFYAFSNLASNNPVHSIFATSLRVGVSF